MYCVIYRVGGTANFRWCRTAAFQKRAYAEICAEDIRRAGYAAHVEVYEHSMSVGLPETYDAATPLPER